MVSCFPVWLAARETNVVVITEKQSALRFQMMKHKKSRSGPGTAFDFFYGGLVAYYSLYHHIASGLDAYEINTLR